MKMDQLNKNKLNIECDWMKSQRLLINPDGQVLPCCYFANVMYMYDKLGTSEKIAEKRNQINDQIGNKNVIQNQTRDSDILMDYYDVIVHVFLKDKRAFFKLEELWGDAKFTVIPD